MVDRQTQNVLDALYRRLAPLLYSYVVDTNLPTNLGLRVVVCVVGRN